MVSEGEEQPGVWRGLQLRAECLGRREKASLSLDAEGLSITKTECFVFFF